MINRIKALLSKRTPPDLKSAPPPTNQNGRDPIEVSDKNLVRARDTLIQRNYSEQHAAHSAKAVRDNWPLEKLTVEKAEAWSNGRVLTLTARSNFSGWLMEGAREIDLAPDATDATLGGALNDVLSYSRELSLRDWWTQSEGQDMSLPQRMALYRAWRDDLMSRHGYKTQRALYVNMLHVGIDRHSGMIHCSPSNHAKLDAWDGKGLLPESSVVVAADSATAALGSALRLVFSRCLDTYGERSKKV